MERHFTNSVYVYNPKTKEFLFIKHKKLKKWLQPGGHWEANELPDDSAIREVFEETGLHVTLVGDRLPSEDNGQIRPYGIQRNIITEGEHEHLDLIYLAIPEDGKIVQNSDETDGIGWFSVDEITSPSFNTFEAQKKWVKYFHGLMNR